MIKREDFFRFIPAGFSYRILYVLYIALIGAGMAQCYSAGIRPG
jgi:hypothetical protein